MNKEAEQLFEMIKRWLKQRKTTQTALAQALGIKQPSLSGMLSGRIRLPKKRLQEIIEFLKPNNDDIALARLLYFGFKEESANNKTSFSDENTTENIKISDEMIYKSNQLKLNLSDQNTYKLLEYWRDLSDSKRYEILAIMAQIKETGNIGVKSSFCERKLDLYNSEVNRGEKK